MVVMWTSQLNTGVLSGVLCTRSAMCRGKMVRQGTARGWARTDRREWSDSKE